MKLDIYGNCPICNKSWDGGEIPKVIRQYYSKPYKWSLLVGLEIQNKYDGVSIWECPHCKSRWDRFTEEIILNTHNRQVKEDNSEESNTNYLETRSVTEEVNKHDNMTGCADIQLADGLPKK